MYDIVCTPHTTAHHSSYLANSRSRKAVKSLMYKAKEFDAPPVLDAAPVSAPASSLSFGFSFMSAPSAACFCSGDHRPTRRACSECVCMLRGEGGGLVAHTVLSFVLYCYSCLFTKTWVGSIFRVHKIFETENIYIHPTSYVIAIQCTAVTIRLFRSLLMPPRRQQETATAASACINL